jgi:hypothetical protein
MVEYPGSNDMNTWTFCGNEETNRSRCGAVLSRLADSWYTCISPYMHIQVRGIRFTTSGHGGLQIRNLGVNRIVVVDQLSDGLRFIVLSVEQNISETQVAVQNPEMIVQKAVGYRA